MVFAFEFIYVDEDLVYTHGDSYVICYDGLQRFFDLEGAEKIELFLTDQPGPDRYPIYVNNEALELWIGFDDGSLEYLNTQAALDRCVRRCWYAVGQKQLYLGCHIIV